VKVLIKELRMYLSTNYIYVELIVYIILLILFKKKSILIC